MTGAMCIAVEPSPKMFLQIPVGEKICKVQAAVAGFDGVISFNVSSRPLESSVLSIDSTSQVETIQVPALTIESIARSMDLKTIDAIKMDIEGMEIAALDACSDEFLQRIGQLSIEFHDFMGVTPKEEVRRVVSRLKQLGFAYVRMSGIGNQDAWFINYARCPIGAVEVMYIRIFVRNFLGLSRILARRFGAIRKITRSNPIGF